MLLFSSGLCSIYQSSAWFPLVTGQAKRMTGSLVKISPPLSTAHLPPLHWTVVHICCHENRPHLRKWRGRFLLYTPFPAARHRVCFIAYERPFVWMVSLRIYRRPLYFTGQRLIKMQLKRGVVGRRCRPAGAPAASRPALLYREPCFL